MSPKTTMALPEETESSRLSSSIVFQAPAVETNVWILAETNAPINCGTHFLSQRVRLPSTQAKAWAWETGKTEVKRTAQALSLLLTSWTTDTARSAAHGCMAEAGVLCMPWWLCWPIWTAANIHSPEPHREIERNQKERLSSVLSQFPPPA